jgi:hypothetical protein
MKGFDRKLKKRSPTTQLDLLRSKSTPLKTEARLNSNGPHAARQRWMRPTQGTPQTINSCQRENATPYQICKRNSFFNEDLQITLPISANEKPCNVLGWKSWGKPSSLVLDFRQTLDKPL